MIEEQLIPRWRLHMSSHDFTRRRFLQGVAATAIFGPLIARGQEKADAVNIACIGVGGKGWSDMNACSVGNNIVAICDVDEERLAKAAKKFPKAKTYIDWRKLLDQKDIDAVTISTPDHTHAPATMTAMLADKHVYAQKPLTHSVYESRRLREVADEKGLVTQMGIQHHASARLKMAVYAIQHGVIGKVKETHVWTDRPGTFWKQGLQRPDRKDGVPPHVNWDLWLGVAPERPYVESVYHPFNWRGWWDFGTGALGDMGCHLLDPVVDALQLGPPIKVSSEGPEPSEESGPEWCIVHYTFAATSFAIKENTVHWYEGGKQPARVLFDAPRDWAGSKNGVLFVGEQGNLFVGFPEMPELFPKEKFADYEWPEMQDHDHYQEWTNAVAGVGETSCPFSYSGPLTETVLLGNVAYRSGESIIWNSEEAKIGDSEVANQLLRREYRDGWAVEGLS